MGMKYATATQGLTTAQAITATAEALGLFSLEGAAGLAAWEYATAPAGSRPRMLDLYCGRGGAGMGYHLAGWDVTGVDLADQPEYPFEFHRADALDYLRRHVTEYDFVHASAPCQFYAWGTPKARRALYPSDHIAQVREICDEAAVPLVMENTPRAEREYRHPRLMVDEDDTEGLFVQRPITLCGLMFGLPLIRHRVFEVGGMVSPLAHVKHTGKVADGDYVTVAGHGGDNAPGNYSLESWQRAMAIPWARSHEGLAQAIPPAYTWYIGNQVAEWL